MIFPHKLHYFKKNTSFGPIIFYLIFDQKLIIGTAVLWYIDIVERYLTLRKYQYLLYVFQNKNINWFVLQWTW